MVFHVGKYTHRRLRLPQRHSAAPATEPQPNSTHSSFRVLSFRGWFGVQIIGCTFKHIPHSTFRVLKLRDWFGVSCFSCALEGILKSTSGVRLRVGLGFHVSSAPFTEYYTPGQTKEPGRKYTIHLGNLL